MLPAFVLIAHYFACLAGKGRRGISNNKIIKHCRVLVVTEDQRLPQYFASLLAKLEHHPFRLLYTKGINQAIAGISKNACDVVLLNYYWGRTAVGEKLLRWAKSKKPQIPIVVFTQKYEQRIDYSVIKAGAADYLILEKIRPESLDRILRHAVDRKTDFSYINYLTHHDHLTSLPNRVLFKQRLRHAIRLAERDQDQFALVLVDINNFKEVNNLYGLDTGDQLLKYFASKLSDAVDNQGNVSRIGGDEFAIILNNLGRIERVQLVAQNILNVLGDKVTINGHRIVNLCSVGIALYPTTGNDENQLQRNASLAVAQAKEKDISSYQFYSSDTERKGSSHGELQDQFVKALANNEIGLYFNPRIDCISDNIIGIEVNPYWSHPHKGLLEYEQFVWNGLDSDIATRFTEWLLATSFEYFKKLKVKTVTKLIFNIEYKGLSSKDFPEIVKKQLEKNALSGDKLEFDLNKVNQDQHNNIIENCMHTLQKQGVTFGINHFGSESQSLTYLKTLPISVLKLNTEFIDEIESGDYDTLMAKALVDFAHGLGKQIVIEGLHSELPLNNIKALGFDYYKSLFSVDALSLVKLQDVMEFSVLQKNSPLSIKSLNDDS